MIICDLPIELQSCRSIWSAINLDIFQQAIRVQIQITPNLAKMAETVRSRILLWDTHANAQRSILGLTVAF